MQLHEASSASESKQIDDSGTFISSIGFPRDAITSQYLA